MRAIILAAGFGTRLKPLTDTTPKPLLEVNKKSLIEYQIESLVTAGIKDIVINVHYLKDKIVDYLGDGKKYGANIIYSVEKDILETGGGILNALPYLGKEPFIVINADIYTDYNFENLKNIKLSKYVAHLVLANNSDKQDFSINNNVVSLSNADKIFCGISLIDPKIFDISQKNSKFSLTLVLKHYIAKKLISGEIYTGIWHNVDSLEKLYELNGKR